MLIPSFLKSLLISGIAIIAFNFGLPAQDNKKYAQVNVITNNKDTIKGFVRVKNFSAGSPTAELTLYENGKEVNTYYPADIKSFFFNDRYFEAVDLASPSCINCKKNSFIERIEHGKINLFFFMDCKNAVNYSSGGTNTKCINYYYMRKNERDTLFLAYREKQNLPAAVQPDNYDDFCNFFKDNSKLYAGLTNKKYSREDIVALVRAYNSGTNFDSLKKQETTPLIDRIVLPSAYDINNMEDYYGKLTEEFKKHEIICEIENEIKQYDDGKMKSRGYYITTCDFMVKIPVGIWISYNRNGTIKKIEAYNQRGERNGLFQYFDENGELTETIEYKKDKKL